MNTRERKPFSNAATSHNKQQNAGKSTITTQRQHQNQHKQNIQQTTRRTIPASEIAKWRGGAEAEARAAE